MVNHMRTALLNVTASQAPDDVYISPSFRPVIVPQYLARIYNVILSPSMVNAKRAKYVNTYMRLLHVADYEPFTLLPDPRITYEREEQDRFFSEAADTSTRIDFEQLLNLMLSAEHTLNAGNYSLFTPVTNYPDVMEQLRSIWNNDLTGIGRLTAGILAFGYQLDDLND